MSLKRLRSSLGTYLSCVKVRVLWGIPIQIDGEERIMRTIFSPANVNEKDNKLRSNFMKPPSCPDEDDPTITSNKLSSTRFDYAGMEFCRAHARNHQSAPRRHYWGFGQFVVRELTAPQIIGDKKYCCVMQNKPAPDNPAHANIVLGFREEAGKTLDSQLSDYFKQLTKSAKVLQDPQPESLMWVGEQVDGAKHRELNYKPPK